MEPTPSFSSTPFLPNLILLVSQTYLELFQVYNDRFISFSHLFQEVEKKQSVPLDHFHQAILELEKQQYFLLGGYSKKDDVPFPQYALFLPDRGYLYWIFRPEPPESNPETTSVVIDLL